MRHGARSHAKYSASNAHRILGCPGQVAAARAAPPLPDTPEQIEGEQAHELLELALREPFAWRAKAPTPEMAAAIAVALDWVEGLFIQRPKLRILSEQSFTFPQDVVPASEAGGIADLVLIDDDAKEAWPVEFKYGHHIVEPEHNPQLMFQAVGLFWHQPMRKIHPTVIQPRVEYHARGAVRTWSCDMLDLIEFQHQMQEAIWAAETLDRARVAGAWCRLCPVEMSCDARAGRALSPLYGDGARVQDIETHTLVPADQLPLDKLTYLLRHEEQIMEYLRAAKRLAGHLERSGIKVPGFKLVEANPRRAWNGDPLKLAHELIVLSGFALGLDDVMPRELLDVTKAEARLKDIAREAAARGDKQAAVKRMVDAMAFLTVRQSSGNLTLVPDSDPRPAVDRTASLFAHVNLPPMES